MLGRLPGLRKALLLHNPDCSKSRAALQLLREYAPPDKIELEVRNYQEEPLSADELTRVLSKLKSGPASWTRAAEPPQTAEAAIAAIVSDPSLLQRPILEIGAQAVVGRPPQNVLDLIAAGESDSD